MAAKRRSEYLWYVKIKGEPLTYFILAGPGVDAATKKAERFFASRAKKEGTKQPCITSIMRQGTIDVF